jgi:chemotaxis protein CheX
MAKPKLMSKNEVNANLGVLIGMTGDYKGQIILKGSAETFSQIAFAMFGMAAEGEFLMSFTGELGNMLAGNMMTFASEEGIAMDITTPTIWEGNTTLHNVKSPVELPIVFEGAGEISYIISVG